MNIPFFSKRTKEKIEQQALKRHKGWAPPARETVSEPEQLQLVAAEMRNEIEKQSIDMSSIGDTDLVKLVQDCTETVISRVLPTKNIRVAGLGTFQLKYRFAEKYNLDPDKIQGPGYKFSFVESKKILAKCSGMLRKTMSIYGEE